MTGRFNPMDHPLARAYPMWLTARSAWVQHIPFGMALVEMCRPSVLVELGAFAGDSYCALCQAVKTLNLSTRCSAVDTWQGDPHAGEYGPDVLEALRDFHDPNFGSSSTLVQCTFDDALSRFPEGSIDLLHIDGLHTYEAVKHDFESWKTKLSRRAVVMFHDTQVRTGDFGVWRLWAELAGRYPSFEFLHGSGLGVLAVGHEAPAPLLRFLATARAQPQDVRGYFEYLGRWVQMLTEWRHMIASMHELTQRVDQHRQQCGQAVQPLDLQGAFAKPLSAMSHLSGGVQFLLESDRESRGWPRQAAGSEPDRAPGIAAGPSKHA